MNEKQFDLRSVTEFERAVLLKALEIPRGEVRTYGWIAAEIGHPAAVRAVGSALRKNPVPVLIPCHRVVRSDGHVGQYALGGTDAKRTILAAEGLESEEIERLARGYSIIGLRGPGAAELKRRCLSQGQGAQLARKWPGVVSQVAIDDVVRFARQGRLISCVIPATLLGGSC